MERKHNYLRIMAICLVFSLLFTCAVLPAKAENETEVPGSERYRTQFTTDLWEPLGEAGRLLDNDTDGVCLDIVERGAGLAATLLDYEGRTPCNALQIVLENRSGCTQARIWVEYRSGDSASCIVTLQPQSQKTVYYAYLSRVEDISKVTVTFNAVSDGEITLYSFSRVSFYQQMLGTDAYGTISDCYYDSKSESVVLSGQLHSDTVVDFFGGSISLYSFRMQEKFNLAALEDVEPLASMRITNRFAFSVSAPTIAERGCFYAVVLTDAAGKRVLMCEPVFPTIAGEREEINTSSAYKGIQSENAQDAMHTYADATIIDVYLDELFALKGGESISYAYEGAYYTYNSAYMLSLERQIIPLMQVDCEVYLRLLISADEDGYALPFSCDQPPEGEHASYLAVTLDDPEAQRAYAAALTYLLNTLTYGDRQISGLVLGREIDRSLQFNYAGMLPLCDYLTVIVNSVLQSESILRHYCPNAILYLPISDTTYPSYYTSYDLDGIYATSMLLDGICRMLDDRGNGAFDISVMLEMHRAPYDLTDAIVDLGSDAVISAMDSHNSTDGLDNKPTISYAISEIENYQCVRPMHSVLWVPPADCSNVAWELSYIYLYYILRDGDIRTFFAGMPTEKNAKVTELLSKIDTSSAFEVVNFAPPYFDMKNVSELQKLSSKELEEVTKLYTAKLIADTRALYTGRYPYWNFAAAIGTLQWSAGYGCSALSADGGSRYGRSLLAVMQPSGGETLYSFTVSENFAVCDALSVTLAVTDQDGNPVDAQIQLTLYGENERVEATCEVNDNDITTLTLTGLPIQAATDCRAISIRAEDGDPEREGELRVYLLHIEGLSRLLDDDALQSEILASRQQKNEDNLGGILLTTYPVLLLTMLALVTTIGLMICIRASQKRRGRKRNRA